VYPTELVSPAAIVKFFQLISATLKGLTRVYAEPKIKFPSNLPVPFTSSFACGLAVPIPTFPFTNKSFANLPVPFTSKAACGLFIPIPTFHQVVIEIPPTFPAARNKGQSKFTILQNVNQGTELKPSFFIFNHEVEEGDEFKVIVAYDIKKLRNFPVVRVSTVTLDQEYHFICNCFCGSSVPIQTLPLKLDRITFPPTFHQLITTLPQVSPSSVEAALIFKLLFPKSANHMFLSPQSLENPKL